MVDEFQDTSLIQYKLMKLLALKDGQSNVCVVGDDDQSIYSWRGASYENLALFEQDFPGVEEIKLEQNYRSTTTILEAANGVIANNTNRKEKRLWSGKSGGKPIEIFYPPNEGAEAAFIASQIKKLRFEENLRYDDFGVLIRTNGQIDCIEEAFLSENIPCKVSGGMSFFEREEIKDVLSYLRVTANPDDDVNLLRIINTPRRGIGKASIAALSELAKKNHSSLWDSLGRYRLALEHGQETLFKEEKAKGEMEEFAGLIETLRENMLGKKGLSGNVKAMVDTVNYWGYLITEHSKDEKKARWKFANISYLIQMIENWEKDPDNLDPSLYAYLNRVSLLTRTEGDGEADKGKVNLMTIHASKGLEFPVVFIAGAEDGIIPHDRSLEDGEEQGGGNVANAMEEERRLFYVAITRARDKLYITSCQQRRRRGETITRIPSPFLEEIPHHLTEYHEPDGEPDQVTAENFFARMRERFGG
jgi:DNA helicase-2/ATP-dependent DNA helicase PcrA